jgi:hypothetical protein
MRGMRPRELGPATSSETPHDHDSQPPPSGVHLDVAALLARAMRARREARASEPARPMRRIETPPPAALQRGATPRLGSPIESPGFHACASPVAIDELAGRRGRVK